MTAKILTPMGKVIHRSTYRPLMPNELTDPVKQDCMTALFWTAEEWWGNHLVRGQLEEVGLIDMPDPQPYLDNQQTDKTFPALKEEVAPKAGDKYIQTTIMIPHGNTFSHGTVVSCKHDAEGHIIGRALDNPILDSCVYDVEFADSEVNALMANANAKAMYAQSDPDGNEYILQDKLINVKRTNDALTLDQQKITVNGTTHQHKSGGGSSSVADGRMALPPGKSCPTSKSPIQSKLLSLQSKWALH